MVTVEQQKLLHVWNLLDRFLGETSWVPCEAFEAEEDDAVFDPDYKVENTRSTSRSTSPATIATQLTTSGQESLENGTIPDDESQAKHTKILMNGGSNVQEELGEDLDSPDTLKIAPQEQEVASGNPIVKDTGIQPATEMEFSNAVETNGTELAAEKDADDKLETSSQKSSTIPADEQEVPARRMTTRARAQASNQGDSSKNDSNTHSRAQSLSSTADIPQPHPLFLTQSAIQPDRDLALPFPEAEDIRRLLLMLVQKREESVKGFTKLRNGLLEANRLRNEVFRWSKAEAHVGEMSDNEDWYDKDEWGLEMDLKKGREEDEEDPAAHRKPTRTRRN
jgi:hypothetical protein